MYKEQKCKSCLNSLDPTAFAGYKDDICNGCHKVNQIKSKCCKSEMKVATADEGTSHYVCLACGKSCDFVMTKTNWEEEFESLWEPTTDNNGEKEPFEYERLKDFVKDLLSDQKSELIKKIKKLNIDEMFAEEVKKEVLKLIKE